MSRTIKPILSLILFSMIAFGCAHVSSEKPAAAPESTNPYLNMILARYEENQGNWTKALELYAKIDDPFALLAQARIYFILNQQDNALKYVDRLIESRNLVDEALELRTKIYARKGDWNQAIKDTESLAKKYPDNIQLKLFLANLKIIVSDFKGAEKILRSLIGKDGNDSMILYALSKTCLGNKDLACAQETLRKVIELSPNFTPAYLDLGKVYELSKEMGKAESAYKKCLEIEPSSVEGLVALTDLYISTKRYKDAAEQLIKLKQLNDDAQIVRKLVLLQLQQGKFEDALANLLAIKEMTVEDSYYLGITYTKLDRLEDALDTLSEVPLTSGLGCETVMLKASILKELGRGKEAIDALNTAWDYFSPKGACKEVGYLLATELDTAGRRDEGMEVAQKILKDNPHDPIALNMVGYVWADRGINLDKAYTMIKEALQAKPDDPYILDSMAWVCYKQGKSEKAIEYLRKALKKLDTDPTIHEHMGDILKSMGKKKKALEHYRKSSSLSKNPQDALKEKINELLE
ncbi:MAG TPA: tetratricopeptide repeat protein [Deltaproteobacteria bacterium]|nr:tetratricopeptide repeat protein [Deltaproteobacteria bacterium]HQJ07785.1 tetratricopeptide repeat protein [Deltaproteobacteria bacterium]